MAQKSFYVDSCIWLNLFKKEGDPSKGTPYWKIAGKFIDYITSSLDLQIIYSAFVLKELQINLDNDSLYEERLNFLREEIKFEFIEYVREDKVLARKLESASEFEISFYDCLHIAICMRTKAVLITRDRKLIEFAEDYVEAKRPEDLIS